MRSHRRWTSGLAVAACALVVTGCTGAQDAAARATAERLLAAAARHDGAAACEALAPATRSELEDSAGKPCAQAVLDEDLDEGDDEGDGTTHVTVFDSMAQVVRGSQTVFLSRFDGTWLVVAAACTPVASRPYDCGIGLP